MLFFRGTHSSALAWEHRRGAACLRLAAACSHGKPTRALISLEWPAVQTTEAAYCTHIAYTPLPCSFLVEFLFILVFAREGATGHQRLTHTQRERYLLGKVKVPLRQQLASHEAWHINRTGAVRKWREIQERPKVDQHQDRRGHVRKSWHHCSLDPTRSRVGTWLGNGAIHTLNKDKSVDCSEDHVREHQRRHVMMQKQGAAHQEKWHVVEYPANKEESCCRIESLLDVYYGKGEREKKIGEKTLL